jgi:hypothetical protein
MRINVLSGKQGSQWVWDGIGYVRAQPVAMLAMTFLYLMCLIIPSMLPGLGFVAPLIVTPFLSVGLMHCARAVDRKQPASPRLLFAGLQDGGGKAWQGLLMMGLVNAVVTAAGLMIASLIDGGTLWKLVNGLLKADDPVLKEPGPLLMGFVSFLFVYIPLQMTLWYSPVFVAWHRMGLMQSLFSSFWAVMQNKRAFLRYGLMWFSVMIAVSLIINVIALATKSPMIIGIVTLPLSTLAIAAVYGSFWPTYRDAIDQTESATEI